MSDHSETETIKSRLRNAANKLQELVPLVALARQVKEFSSDRRKNLLAEFMAPLVASGSSVAAAEIAARANPDYQAKFTQIETQHRDAEKTIARWDATKVTFEAARSLFSLNKEMIANKYQND